jgi:hypothetical protein
MVIFAKLGKGKKRIEKDKDGAHYYELRTSTDKNQKSKEQ